jgi:hypothetical protein
MTKEIQLFALFICTQSALHISGDVFAHLQEHLTVFTASDIVHRILLLAGVMDELERSSNSSMTPAGSNIGGQYQKL